MRTRHWLLGLILCLAGIGSVTATSVDTQDIDSSAHASADSAGSARESTGSGGDALGLSRDRPSHSSSSTTGSGGDSSGGSNSSMTGSASDHSGDAGPAPRPVHQSHLGWQSLLPGSIQ